MAIGQVCLGIEDLPDRIGRLAVGAMYAIACEDPSIRQRLIAAALYHTLLSGRPAVLISAAGAQQFLRRADQDGFDLSGFIQKRQLQLLRHPPHADTHLQQVGARQFIDELDRAELHPGSLILFDEADPLYLLSDPRHAAAAIQIYSSWSDACGHTVLGVFNLSSQAPRQFVTLMALAEHWAGFALIANINQRVLLDLRHWRAQAGDNPRQCFELNADLTGRLSAQSLHADPLDVGNSAADQQLERCVIAVRGSFGPEIQAARTEWHWIDAAENAADKAREFAIATVVLQFADSGEFERLCQAVVALRQLGNCALRIVVRERAARLRMPMAMTLFRMGVSLIIPAGSSDSNARLQIEALQGSRLIRVFDSNVARVQQELKRVLNSDPHNTIEFRAAVEQVLAQSESYQIEHALVRLYSKSGQQARAIELLSRQGRDLLMAVDGAQIWLFLFACERSEVRGTLERLFANSLNELFTDRAILFEPQRMLAALESIRLPKPVISNGPGVYLGTFAEL
jgi:cellulose biosynthesis protein BcsE